MTHFLSFSRILLSAILAAWAVLFLQVAFVFASKGGAQAFGYFSNVSQWVFASISFSLCAIFSWSSITTLLGDNYACEGTESASLSLSSSIGVTIAYGILMPHTGIWYVFSLLGFTAAFILSAFAAAQLMRMVAAAQSLAKQTCAAPQKRLTNAHEIAMMQSLYDRWPR